MNKSIQLSRRNFIKQTTIASTAFLLPINSIASNFFSHESEKSEELSISIFSKHLQFLDYKSMSEAVKEMGFDSIDLTVRPKGHVLPERVSDDLPKATEFMKSYGLNPLMISSNVIDANNPIHIKVLKIASELGYKFYRPDWIKYSKNNEILADVKQVETTFKNLTKLNKKLGISASYQNHSGLYFGSGIWDLYQVIHSMNIAEFGSQYDIMHASVEGGKNWEIGFKLIKPHINTLVVKDFIWEKNNGVWKPKFVPMGEGMVNFKRYFSLLKKFKLNVPISIHVEYDLGGAEKGGIPTISNKEIFKRIKKDLTFVRQAWSEAEE